MDCSITAQGVIDAHPLYALLAAKNTRVKLLDASYAMPGEPHPLETYKNKRIGEAVFFDIGGIADQNSALPHMLPGPEYFAESVGALGITNDDTVVIYGQSGMIMGPARAWWMFRTFGHDRVCVLDGGLPAWMAAGYELRQDPPPEPVPAPYKADFRPSLVADLQAVRAHMQRDKALLLDARPPARFSGASPEPRPGLRSGHIPDSLNIPAGSLIDPQTGRLKSREELERIFAQSGVDDASLPIATCGSGITACVIALGLFTLGRADIAVYDGSWSEWGQEKLNMPVAQS